MELSSKYQNVDYSKILSLVDENHSKLRHNLLMPIEIRSNSIIDWVGEFTPESIQKKFWSNKNHLINQGFPKFFFDLFNFGIQKAHKKVDSFTNMAVFLQGDFSSYGPSLKRTDMFDHFHTPRQKGNKCYSMTLFFPIDISEPSEEFYYYDLQKLGCEVLPYQTPEVLVADYNRISSQIEQWEKIPIPVDSVLELNFCSSRLFHSVRHFKNIYMVFIFNDARFNFSIEDSEILRFRHPL